MRLALGRFRLRTFDEFFELVEVRQVLWWRSDKIQGMAESTPQSVYEVLARWDTEAGVWVAESDDVPGLVAEADSPNLLAQKLKTLIPELLELNGVLNGRRASFHVQYQHEDSSVLTY